MEKVINYLEARQVTYSHLPRTLQLTITAIALLFAGAGVVLTISPISDVGLLLLILSLGVLSFEFAWAKRSLHYMLKKLSDKKFMRILGIIAVVAIIVVVYFVFFAHHH